MRSSSCLLQGWLLGQTVSAQPAEFFQTASVCPQVPLLFLSHSLHLGSGHPSPLSSSPGLTAALGMTDRCGVGKPAPLLGAGAALRWSFPPSSLQGQAEAETWPETVLLLVPPLLVSLGSTSIVCPSLKNPGLWLCFLGICLGQVFFSASCLASQKPSGVQVP